MLNPDTVAKAADALLLLAAEIRCSDGDKDRHLTCPNCNHPQGSLQSLFNFKSKEKRPLECCECRYLSDLVDWARANEIGEHWQRVKTATEAVLVEQNEKPVNASRFNEWAKNADEFRAYEKPVNASRFNEWAKNADEFRALIVVELVGHGFGFVLACEIVLKGWVGAQVRHTPLEAAIAVLRQAAFLSAPATNEDYLREARKMEQRCNAIRK